MPSLATFTMFMIIVSRLDSEEKKICKSPWKYETPKANANGEGHTRLRPSWGFLPSSLFCKSILDVITKPIKLPSDYNAEECMRACEAEPKCVAINHFRSKSRCELFTRICKSPLQKREGASAYVLDRAAFSTKRKGG